MEIALQHILAEAVNRGDLGVIQQGKLSLQILILRVLFQALVQCVTYPLLHLTRRRLCKGDDQQLINVHGTAFIRHHGQDTLHQDCCLA